MISYHYSKETYPDQAVRVEWVKMGCPVPPHDPYKHATLNEFRKWSGAKILVETGTFEGGTTNALAPFFENIYTIEGSPTLFEKARERFKNTPNVTCILGDSAAELPKLLKDLKQRAVFWLDAHWCGGETAGAQWSSAIMPELEALFTHKIKDHVIIIDDARFFAGEFGYPSINYLRKWVASRRPELVFDVAVDSIRIHPMRV